MGADVRVELVVAGACLDEFCGSVDCCPIIVPHNKIHTASKQSGLISPVLSSMTDFDISPTCVLLGDDLANAVRHGLHVRQ